MIEKGCELAELGHFEEAEKYFRRALQVEPDNVELIDLYAELLLDLGESDKARLFLMKSIERHGDAIAEPYMYMGQLSTGRQAVAFYEHGVSILMKQPESAERNEKVCRGLCGIADLFMTDLCFEQDAEQQCERAMTVALSVMPNNVEALQTLASIRISQQRPEEAKETLLRSLSLWHVPIRKVSPDAPIDEATFEDEEGDNGDGSHELPILDFRIQTAKILMELGLQERAIEVLERLLYEDAMVLGIWYLLTACHASLGNKDIAIECAAYGLKIATEGEYEEDVELVQQMKELADEVGASLEMVAEIPSDFLVRRFGPSFADAADEDDEENGMDTTE
eukprot:ANDGO_06286.mRNA.1 putative assembly chaperone of rpl4